MQSNNPVFRNSDSFNGRGTSTYADQTYPANGAGYDGYGQNPTTIRSDERMTIDSVVQKTGISLGIVVVVAALTWWFTPPITGDPETMGPLIGAMTIGSLAAFGLSMVNSFKKVISPALVIAFCVAEGVALGALSKFFDGYFGDGIVTQAVLGTFAAFGGTLAAYKFFDIKVGQKFRTFVVAAVFGMVGLSLLEMGLGLFGSQLGLFGFGGIGLLFAIVGLVLGVFMLILDFDFVEQGVAAGIPERESWRAAFALTVALVWIYTNLLRILAIFSSD